MVKLALRQLTKVFMLAVPCCMAAVLLFSTLCFATDQNVQLAELEQHLFLRTYQQEEVSRRLERIEQRVFGQCLTGSTDERLNKILSVTGHPDELNSSAKSISSKNTISPKTTPEDSDEIAFPRVVPHSQSEQAEEPKSSISKSPTVNSAEDEKAYSKERARIAAKAAREEEIAALLADGVSLWRKKNSQAAQDKFEQVIRLDPFNAEAHFSMGIIQETSGNIAGAIAHYQVALKTHPDSEEYKTTLAKAEEKLNNQPKLNPSQIEAHNLAESAAAAYKRGEILSALDLYKQADNLSPNQALVKYNIGTIYLILKEPGKALIYYRQAAQLDPNDNRFSQAYEKLQSAASQVNLQTPEAVSFAPSTYLATTPLTSPNAPQNTNTQESILGLTVSATKKGLCVQTVLAASRAARAGLQPGDIIMAVDGKVVTQEKEFKDLLAQKNIQAPISLFVQRNTSISKIDL